MAEPWEEYQGVAATAVAESEEDGPWKQFAATEKEPWKQFATQASPFDLTDATSQTAQGAVREMVAADEGQSVPLKLLTGSDPYGRLPVAPQAVKFGQEPTVGPQLEGPVGAAFESARNAVIPAAGGLGAAAATLPIATALAPVTLGTSFAIPIVAGFFGGIGAAKAQETVRAMSETPQATEARRSEDARLARKFPKATLAGEIAPQLATFRPSLAANLLNRGVNAAIGGAQSVGIDIATGQPISGARALEGAALGALLDKPTALGRSMGFSDTANVTPENVEKYQAEVATHLETVPQETLATAAADPDFRKSAPYDPALIDAEIARRTAAEAFAPETARAVADTLSQPPNAQPATATSTTPATTEATPARVAPGEPAPAEPVNPLAREGVTEPLPASPVAPAPSPVGSERPVGEQVPVSGAIRPALLAPDGTVLVEGKSGQTHGDVQSEAIRGGDVDAADATRAFVGADGKPMTRAEAWISAKAAGEIKPETIAAKDGPNAELQSEDLIAHGRAPDGSPAPGAEPIIERLQAISDGEPVTLYHGSPNTALNTIKPNSSLTLSRPLAEKFATKKGRVYEVRGVVPANRPIIDTARDLLADVRAGKISPEDAEARFANFASEIKLDQELATAPVKASAVLTESVKTAAAPKMREGQKPIAEDLLPEQAELAAPKLDPRKSPFALGISPDNKAVAWLGKNVKRLFTATGDLPKETFEGWIERNGYVKAESRQVAYATRDLYGALREEFGISKTEELTKGFGKVPREFVKQMNDALLGEVDINTLPEKVRAPLQAMRDHIDSLSQKMLSEGVIPESLQAKVADNLGVYMTRSYRVFDDPKWAESIPADVRNRTRDFILTNLRKENPAATPENARAVMESMLQDWRDQGTGALVKSGGKLGSKDLTSLITRKDIPKVVREFMGEYNDPLVNYARSVTKAANLIGSQRFLNEVRAVGVGKFLFEDGQQPATHSALIAAEGSDVMAPLNGLRTTPEIAAAFKEFGKVDPIKNGIFRSYIMAVGAAKTAKTVGSVMTQARNLFGQSYFFAMNGHFNMTKAAPAVKAVMADLGATDSTIQRAAYQRYLRLGVVDQSARASELRDTIRDAGLNDPGVSLSDPGKVWAKTARKLTLDAAARAYQVSDDLGKIIGFENEMARQREIHPDWSDATIEATSAERIRNTYPTYSMIPEGVRKARQLPFAPFISFASETYRTAYHNLRYTIEDLQSTIPAQRKAGAQRLAGQMAVAGSGYALSAISQGLLGMNAQDEDDARRFMAPWDKDSQIVFTGKDAGETTFLNMSYVNPYSYLTDPVVAVASGLRSADELDDVMLRSFKKLAQPFTSEDILAGALVDIARNKTATGRRVFNPGDTAARQWEDKFGHLYKAVEPGTLTRAKSKLIPAIKGETSKTGQVPKLTQEVLSELTGFKTQTLDYAQAVGFRALQFKKDDDDADSIFREVAGRRGTVAPDAITDAYQRASRSKFEAWKTMYGDAQAAQRRGVNREKVRSAMQARGISGQDARSVMDGKFRAPGISPALKKQMRENNHALPAAVSQEMQRANGLVLSGSFR